LYVPAANPVASTLTVSDALSLAATLPLSGVTISQGTSLKPPVAKARQSTSAPPENVPTSELAPVVVSIMRNSPVEV
jgi:hypothetical protein